MKYISRPLYLLAVIVIIAVSCNNTESSKAEFEDSADKKLNPAGEQKSGSTYNPKELATDTMYKDKDSIPK